MRTKNRNKQFTQSCIALITIAKFQRKQPPELYEPIDSPSWILNKEKEAKGAFPMTMGDPKSRNDRTVEWGNGGKKTPNPKRRNDGKSLEILEDEMMENHSKSQTTEV